MTNGATSSIPAPQFPTQNAPRVWLITSGDCPIGISVARKVLAHGDYVVSGIIPAEFERDGARSEEFKDFLAEVGQKSREGWKERLRIVALDKAFHTRRWERLRNGDEANVKLAQRTIGQCQAAVAEAVDAFGRVDILLSCTSQAIVGTVEELAATPRTLSLVRDQFETNFFGPMNIIKATLPEMRNQRIGHMIVLGGITGHLGTPGLGMYCSSGWALEGFCDSMAYEIAPFNIKMTIVQASIEIGILTNRITSAPPLEPYSPDTNHAPLFRGILDGVLNRLPGIIAEYPQDPASPQSSSSDAEHPDGPSLLSWEDVVSLYPPLSHGHAEKLIAETVHALTAIAGHENPPARHIVGVEGVASVKEKLKTVSEELEDFVEVSGAVDIDADDSKAEQFKTGQDADGSTDFGGGVGTGLERLSHI